jgi:hypothetical protein
MPDSVASGTLYENMEILNYVSTNCINFFPSSAASSVTGQNIPNDDHFANIQDCSLFKNPVY